MLRLDTAVQHRSITVRTSFGKYDITPIPFIPAFIWYNPGNLIYNRSILSTEICGLFYDDVHLGVKRNPVDTVLSNSLADTFPCGEVCTHMRVSMMDLSANLDKDIAIEAGVRLKAEVISYSWVVKIQLRESRISSLSWF